MLQKIFIDCVSFVVMRELGIKEAFAFDEHFNQMGFIPVHEMAWVVNSVELALSRLGRREYDGTANRVFNEAFFGTLDGFKRGLDT